MLSKTRILQFVDLKQTKKKYEILELAQVEIIQANLACVSCNITRGCVHFIWGLCFNGRKRGAEKYERTI